MHKVLNKNTEINSIRILEFYGMKNTRAYYNTLCLKCNKKSIRRLDQIKIATTCKYCKDIDKIGKIQSVINNLYRSYKNSAYNKKLEFTLELEEFKNIIEKDCHYCGNPPIETNTSKLRNFSKEKYLHNGVDRIDSTKGYEKNNIVTCCSMCNYMKRNYTIEDFLNQVCKIYNFKKEKDE